MCRPKVVLFLSLFCFILGLLAAMHLPRIMPDLIRKDPEKPIQIQPNPPAPNPLENGKCPPLDIPVSRDEEVMVLRFKLR